MVSATDTVILAGELAIPNPSLTTSRISYVPGQVKTVSIADAVPAWTDALQLALTGAIDHE